MSNLNLTTSNSAPADASNAKTTAAIDPLYLGRNYGEMNVIDSYRWTLSENFNKDEVPRVILIEYEVDESTIQTQLEFYLSQAKNVITDSSNPLAVYENLYPRKSTGNYYVFPYFSEVNFEVTTPVWGTLDTLPQMAKGVEGIAGFLGGEKAAEAVGAVISGASKMGGLAMGALYPQVGIMDRPRLWQSHDFRTIEIKFPLFNTYHEDDWKKNRGLCWTLINSNLFQKSSFITGVPPVYYEVKIPGQHYSYASCVTNLKIYNRGNMRMLNEGGSKAIVPDAFEVVMTLTDMVMPSRNLFQNNQDDIVSATKK